MDINIGSSGNYKIFSIGWCADIRTYGNDAIICASMYGHPVVKLLVFIGADIHADNDDALRYASNNGHLEVVI